MNKKATFRFRKGNFNLELHTKESIYVTIHFNNRELTAGHESEYLANMKYPFVRPEEKIITCAIWRKNNV